MITTLSVKEIVYQIKHSLENEFKQVAINGEVSNLSSSSAGHWYFTLSDSEASIAVALFKVDAFRNQAIKKIKNGDKISVFGPVNVYSKRGTFQLVAKAIKHAGKGDLKEQLEALKAKLRKDGIFDLENKKQIPKIPSKVAIITALQGAALQDFLNIYSRRSFHMEILILPTLVQGNNAPASIISSINLVSNYNKTQSNKSKQVDVIVLARGGGSLEDLWAFNDEDLANTIYKTEIPIISAIGHQSDYSISDMASDLRCETPSSAAELLTAEQLKIDDKITILSNKLVALIDNKIMISSEKVEKLSPLITIDILWDKYNILNNTVQKGIILKSPYETLNIYEKSYRLDECNNKLNSIMNINITEKTSRLEKGKELLHTLNPSNILKRGYSYLTTGENDKKSIINSKSSFDKVAKKEKLKVSFFDGTGIVSKD